MTIAEHTHEDLATKEDVADYKVIIADAILSLTTSNLAANARVDALVNEMHEIPSDLQKLTESVSNLIETNRRAIGFTSSDD